MSDREKSFIIHKDGRGYYRPEARGYTTSADEAGRFNIFDAIAYSFPNGKDGPRDGLTYQHESTLAVGQSCEKDLINHDLRAERDALLKVREDLSEQLNEAAEKIASLQSQLRGTEAAADSIARAFA